MPNPHSVIEDRAALLARRRRLEAEMLMCQADRTKVRRQHENMEIERRMVEKDIETRQAALETINDRQVKLQSELQSLENEIVRIRKQMNMLGI